MDFKVYLSKIFQNSVIFQNSDINNNQTLNFMFKNLTFQDNIYDPSINFVILRKLNSANQNIKFEILNLFNNNGTNLLTTFMDYQKSLIYIESQQIIIKRFNLLKSYGLTDIFIKEAEIFTLYDSHLSFEEQFRFQGLHQNQNCQKNINIAQSYAQIIAIYSTKIVSIRDTVIDNLEIYNFPVISFQSAEQQLQLQNETFLMENVQIINNLIIQTESQLTISIINIQSKQIMSINLNNIIFQNNIRHSYQQNTQTASSILFNIDCSKCQTIIQNSEFQSNIITNSTDSKSKSILIQNCLFQYNSLFKYKILQPYLIWGFQNEIVYLEHIEEIFPIKSQSGNGILIGERIKITNITITYSSGLLGGGFQIIPQDNSIVSISNSYFKEIKTIFSQQIEQGGIFYIDGSESESMIVKQQILLHKTFFVKIREEFFIKSGNQNVQIEINELNLTNIFSEQGSIGYFQFLSLSTQNQTLKIQDLEIKNTPEGFENYLNNFYTFLQDDQKVLQNNRTMVYVSYDTTMMFNRITFLSTLEESLFELNGFKQAVFQEIKSMNSKFNTIYVKLYPVESSPSYITIRNIYFSNISTTQQINQYICYQKLTGLPKNLQYCLSSLNKAPETLLKYQSKEKQIAYQKSCLSQNYETTLASQNFILIQDNTGASTIVVTEMILESINCSQCQEGLLAVRFTQSKSKVLQDIKINNVFIENSNCGLKGCQNFQKTITTSQATSTRFLLNFDISSLVYELYLKNIFCQNNTAESGTCLYISNLSTLMESSFFTKNNASLYGGAVYVSELFPVILLDCVLIQNQASIGGGMYFEEHQVMNYTKLNNEFEDNKALLFGNNYKVQPEKIKLQIGKEILAQTKVIKFSVDEKIEEVSSIIRGQENILLPCGQQISKYEIFDVAARKYVNEDFIFRLQALEFDGTLAKIKSRKLNQSQLIVDQEFTNNFTNLKNIDFNQKTYDYNLDSLIIYFDSDLPSEIILQLEFQCNSILVPIYQDQFPYQLKKIHSNYKFRVNIKTLPCQYGEIKNGTDNSCHICDSSSGFFSLKLNSTQCELKDEVSTISVMPALLEIRQGFWRPYLETSQVSLCSNFQNNCLGGWTEGDSSCIIGHLGALCEQCDIYDIRGSGSFSVSEKYQCGSCTDQTKMQQSQYQLLYGLFVLYFFQYLEIKRCWMNSQNLNQDIKVNQHLIQINHKQVLS